MDKLTTLAGELFLAMARFFFPHRAKARYLVILGGPGAGKGSITELLEPRTGLPKFGMGAVVREYIETPRGRKWAPLVKKGGLLPDRIVLWRLFLALRQRKYDKGAILDGVPRTRTQARFLRLLLAFWGHRFEDAILLEVSEADTVERISGRRSCPNSACGKSFHVKFNPPKREGVCDRCGSTLVQRDDDKPEAVTERLRLFNQTSGPLFDYFDELGVLHRIQSTNEKGVDQVLEDVYFTLEETD